MTAGRCGVTCHHPPPTNATVLPTPPPPKCALQSEKPFPPGPAHIPRQKILSEWRALEPMSCVPLEVEQTRFQTCLAAGPRAALSPNCDVWAVTRVCGEKH